MWARGWGYGAVRPRVQCVETFSILNTPFYSSIYTLRSLLRGTYAYRYLLLAFLFKSLIIISRRYTLFISLYKR